MTDNNSQPQTEKLLAEALPEGIALLDENDRLLWWNEVIQTLLGLTSSHRNQSIHAVISQDKFRHLLVGEVLELNAPNDENTRLAIRVRNYFNQRKILIVNDITHTYRLEKMRQDFIANVSHELRTPLTVFHGYLELLLDQSDIDKEQIKKILEQMSEQNARMQSLVSNLLLLSRLESDEPDMNKHHLVAVAEMIRGICADAKAVSGENKHEFIIDVDEGLQIEGGAEELHSAFSNIVVNAVRYTPPNGQITVRWYADEDAAYFEVTDTGIGIADKHINRITQRFYRVDKARSREKGGTGLGLAIVKHVLLRHNGDLTIESTVNEGSTFRCTFPLN